MTRFLRNFRTFCAIANAAVFLTLLGNANAEIAVSPLRAVLSPTDQSTLYDISNSSDRIAEVKIDWIDLWATEDGYRKATPEERQKISAARYLTVEPAFLRLEPGARGVVKVNLKKNAELPNRELRSHLLFSSNAARTQLRKTGGGLEVDAKLQISTPVIVRSKAIQSNLKIQNVRLLRDNQGHLDLKLTLSMDGQNSVLGQLTVNRIPTDQTTNPPKQYIIKNLAIYSDTGMRTISVPLKTSTLSEGHIQISYDGMNEFSGKQFAMKSFAIAGSN